MGAKAAGDSWWRGRAATNGAAAAPGAGSVACAGEDCLPGRGCPAPLLGLDRLKLATEMPLVFLAVAREFTF